MEHRGIEYTIVQGIDPAQRWKWTVILANRAISGSSSNRLTAEADAIRTIDRVLLPKKGEAGSAKLKLDAATIPASIVKVFCMPMLQTRDSQKLESQAI